MKPATSTIKYSSFMLIFILIISIIIIAKLKHSTIDNSAQNLNPKSSINIKYQLPWQREFYFNRIKVFKENPIGNNKIVFLGNSITAGGGNWSQRFNTNNIVNRGILGDYTEGVLNRLNEIIYYKPIAVFLLIGVNEFFKDNSNNTEITPAYVADNILKIAEKKHNLNPNIFEQLVKSYEQILRKHDKTNYNNSFPIDILDYCYSILYSPSYRKKYKEYLKSDFPKIPFTKHNNTFYRIANLGNELREMHLLESPKLEKIITKMSLTYDKCIFFLRIIINNIYGKQNF